MQLRASTSKLLGTICTLALLAIPVSASPSARSCATKADAQSPYGGSGGHSIWLPGIATDFIFAPDPGVFTEPGDGSGRIVGTVRSIANPAQAFRVDLSFSGYSATAPPDSPHTELSNSAYVWGGGPIDPATWHYYSTWSGTFTGIDAFAGAVLDVARRGPSFQVGTGANGKNLNYGASGWLHWTVAHQPNSGSLQSSGDGDINIDLGNCPPASQACAGKADGDPTYNQYPSGHAFWLPGIGTDFVFSPDRGSFTEAGDGTASLIGTLRKSSDPTQGFTVNLSFSAYSTTAPPDSPHLELLSNAYVANGGPINPATWHYFSNWSGTLTGIDAYAGATLSVVRRGAAFQVGTGANGKNLRYGASGWLSWTVTHQPASGSLQSTGDGDIDIDIGDCITTTEICVREAIGDENLPGVLSNHAISLPGITKKLTFEPLGQLIEASDGSATLVGSSVDRNAPQKLFDVQLTLSGRTTTPPPGSPVLALAPSSYVAGGGTINPSSWVYYTSFTGTLTGHGTYEGAVLAISSASPAWQQGVGANNKNDELGAAARFTWVTLHQPQTGTVPGTGSGDLNIDLTTTCSPLLGSGHAKIGDTVWNDLDHDGVQDVGEPGLEGVLVRLYKDGVQVDAKLTNSSGYYSFPSIPQGNYTVVIDPFTLPAGFQPSSDLDGLVTAHKATFALTDHQIFLDVDFGYAVPAPAPVCLPGVGYGVHAAGGANSQLFWIGAQGAIGAMGGVHEGYDLKALDVSPVTNTLYAIAGGGGGQGGNLYVVDKVAGGLVLIGNTGAGSATTEITDVSFHPDGTLWAFQKGVGLLTVDLATGGSTLEWTAGSGAGSQWQGLAWDNQGQMLYGSEGTNLYRWDPTTLGTELACSNLPADTRALDVAGDGKLIGAVPDPATGELEMFEINPATCDLRTGQMATSYSNVESLAFENCGQPAALHGPIFSSGFENGFGSWTVGGF